MVKGKNQRRPIETALEMRSRMARERDMAETAKRPLVTAEMAQHGDYREDKVDVSGRAVKVMINRGGSTVQRWLHAANDDHIGDAEKAAIRYCMALWQRLDRKGPRDVVVDCSSDGMSEHEALSELARFKREIPPKYWAVFENVCRFEQTATARHTKVTVAFVAGMIAMWCRL